jgi:hypothetical protein
MMETQYCSVITLLGKDQQVAGNALVDQIAALEIGDVF